MRNSQQIWLEKYHSIQRLQSVLINPVSMGSEKTLENYIWSVQRFVQFLKQEKLLVVENPDLAISRLQVSILNPQEVIDKSVSYFLEKKGLAHNTVLGIIYGVKKWMDVNYVKVDWKNIDMPKNSAIQEKGIPPTKEEIKTLLDHAYSLRDRVVILILISSGLGIGTLLRLKVGNVDFNYSDVARIKIIKKSNRKFEEDKITKFYCTWITPEARNMLEKYLAERLRMGEEVNENSPMITDDYRSGKPITTQAWALAYHRLLKRSGLDQKGKKWYKRHIHTMRKFFRSNCIGVDSKYLNSWLGQKEGYENESFFKAEEHHHLREYRKAIPHLSVSVTSIEEKIQRIQILLDFAKLQGYPDEKLIMLKEKLEESKTIDEGIEEFRKLNHARAHL